MEKLAMILGPPGRQAGREKGARKAWSGEDLARGGVRRNQSKAQAERLLHHHGNSDNQFRGKDVLHVLPGLWQPALRDVAGFYKVDDRASRRRPKETSSKQSWMDLQQDALQRVGGHP
eukprot:2656095-Heterocapsa_arctica.AAC.1